MAKEEAFRFRLQDLKDMQKQEETKLSFMKEQIQSGYPVIIGWNDWGGHWEVAIGYDTMGTEHEGDDVLIFADPFDTTDHNQDGYGVINAERFICNFTFYDFFPADHLRNKCFIIVKLASMQDTTY